MAGVMNAATQHPSPAANTRPALVRERDDVECGACGERIPNIVDGTLYNRFHAPHCQFHAS